MKKQSKRIEKLITKVTNQPIYSIDEGILLLRETGNAKFIESTEAHVTLNIDPKYANQQLRTSLVLPYGTGKTIRIAVFTESDYVNEVLNSGATIAGSDDLSEEISSGKIQFDLLI
jgi:large subunit ribosomal protein L1